jgi:predicted nucleic acid-binding protein
MRRATWTCEPALSFLLDTCVLSDAARNADAGLLAWLEHQSPLDLHISVLSLGEIQKGIALLPRGKRRAGLEAWLGRELPARFAGRVLSVTPDVALAGGRLTADGQKAGRRLPAIDGLLLATALAHGLTLVTRNTADTVGRGVAVDDPYTGARP